MADIAWKAAYVDGSDVSKTNVRNMMRDQVVHAVADAATLAALSTYSTVYFTVAGVDYKFDSADTTSSHSPPAVIVTADGGRYKPITVSSGGGGSNSTADGRLTLSTGVPVMTSAVSAATTLYYTPFVGNGIALYDGSSAWSVVTFTERSISLSGTSADTNYDVFAYNNGGTVTLELVAWTNATTRATALAYQNGVLVKSGATTRRYLGTIRTGSSGQCSWSLSGNSAIVTAHVFNMYNRRRFSFEVYTTGTASRTATTAVLRALDNGDTDIRVSFVRGVDDAYINAHINGLCAMTEGANVGYGIGFDTTSDASGTETWSLAGALVAAYGSGSNLSAPAFSEWRGNPLGHHYLQALERSQTSGATVTWYYNLTAGNVDIRAKMFVEGDF